MNKNIRKLQNERTQLKKKISEQEQLLRSTKKDVKSQLNDLMLLNSQIGEQQKYVDGIQGEVNALNGNISALQRELMALNKDLDECKRKYRRSVNYMFRNRSAYNRLVFIFSATDFRQMYRRLRYVKEYSKFQRAQGEIIAKKEAVVRAKQQELRKSKSEKDKLLAEGRTQHRKLVGQQQERQTLVNELNKRQSELQKSIAQQRKKYESLNARIDKLIQQEIAAAERRRKAAEARRKAEAERRRKAEAAAARREAARKKRGGKAGKAEKATASGKSSRKRTAEPVFVPEDNVDRRLSSNFAANRGRLPVPITGSYVVSGRYGGNVVNDLKGVKLDNKGVNITGRKGAQARCVFDGEVTAVFSFGGMVNVIVRHGSYISVYCNLSSSSVRQGQKVSTRQTLGTVATDASGNCTLHFQLRKETARLNPETWLAI